MAKRTACIAVSVLAISLIAAVALKVAPVTDADGALVNTSLGYSEIPNGRGGTNVESIVHTKEMVRPEDLKYVEAGQLTCTLTRPDVYNAIMAYPGSSHELERELGVDKSNGMDSCDYMLTYEAITVDSRMMWRAKTPNGYYWKTFDIFTGARVMPSVRTSTRPTTRVT